MAISDEEEMLFSTTATYDNQDVSDETQDFRFLDNFSLAIENLTLPKRGEKDFEPHGTSVQQDELLKSRSAMHNALSFPRLHAPISRITGYYNDTNGLTMVEHQKGQHFRTMGMADSTGTLFLLPEEALYLVDRGNLDLRWSESNAQSEIPFSMQTSYSVLVPKLQLNLERYTVYTILKRSGYIVQRSPAWSSNIGPRHRNCIDRTMTPTTTKTSSWLFNMVGNASSVIKAPIESLVGSGLYRSYSDMYRRLVLIPCHDTAVEDQYSSDLESAQKDINKHKSEHYSGSSGFSPLQFSFYVWKPRPDFRKSAPGPPDFLIVVLAAHEGAVPTLEQMDELFWRSPHDLPPQKLDHQLYQRLKHGRKNVILAIVNSGVVSFIRVADAAFGRERLYDRAKKGREGKRGAGIVKGKGMARKA